MVVATIIVISTTCYYKHMQLKKLRVKSTHEWPSTNANKNNGASNNKAPMVNDSPQIEFEANKKVPVSKM